MKGEDEMMNSDAEREGAHKERDRILKALKVWRTQYESSMPGPYDLNAICRTCVDSAIRIVEQECPER
jgi:hypothetical protein